MNDLYNRESEFVTPEQVKISLRTAGLGSRAVALLLDSLIMLACFLAVILAIGLGLIMSGNEFEGQLDDLALALMLIAIAALIGGYYIIMEYYYSGQTLGKRWTGLRVIQENGQPLTLLSSIIRNTIRLIDFLPAFYFLGAGWMFFNAKDRRLGDLAAGTVVVLDTRYERERNRKRLTKWINKRYPHLTVTLVLSDQARREIVREDWLLLSAFVEGLPYLNEQQNYKLAHEIAGRLSPRLGIRPNFSMVQTEQFLVELYLLLRDEWAL